MNSIYVVTVIKGSKQTARTRTWGWFESVLDAEKSILVNDADMFEECYYDHAVVEEMGPGIWVRAKEAQWYFADYPDGEDARPVINKVSKPEWAKSICNWGMG